MGPGPCRLPPPSFTHLPTPQGWLLDKRRDGSRFSCLGTQSRWKGEETAAGAAGRWLRNCGEKEQGYSASEEMGWKGVKAKTGLAGSKEGSIFTMPFPPSPGVDVPGGDSSSGDFLGLVV